MTESIKREKHKSRRLCDHCSDRAVVKFSVKGERKVHRAYACSKPSHERRAEYSLELQR